MKMFGSDEVRVGLIASANVTTGAVQSWISSAAPVAQFALTVVQIAVAIVTVIYIASKVRELRDEGGRKHTRKRKGGKKCSKV